MKWRTWQRRLVLGCPSRVISRFVFPLLAALGTLPQVSLFVSVAVLSSTLPTGATQSLPSALKPVSSSSLPFSTSSDLTCEFDDVRRRRDKVIRIGVILPMYDADFKFGLMYTRPSFEIAREEIYSIAGLLNGYSIEFDYRDSNCSDVYGPLEGIEMYANKEVDLFIGPFCDYAVAPLARFASFWEIPIMTAGGLVEELNDKTRMYRLLTRMIPPYTQLAECVVTILMSFKYQNVGMILHQWKNPNKPLTDQWFTLEAVFLLIQRIWNPGISMEYAKTFDVSDYTEAELESHLRDLSRICRGERSRVHSVYL
ncbi:guanylate cyclase [Elysia marginata]|uniref:Guanylate cyclase n=1 Tax=Elysia marginata TaxID=1093978 RepID=A0AAV4GZF7_9GAST|nr:guanylate cyclase [Elysia marginata]